MLRKLLIIACLSAGINVNAQDLVPMYVPSSTPKAVTDDGDKSDFTKMGAQLPKFRMVTLPLGIVKKINGTEVKRVTVSSRSITQDDVKNNANLFVMVFNPNCGHCELQTDTLEKHLHLFKKSKLVLICAPNMGSYLETFEKQTNCYKYPAIQIGMDSSAFIHKVFLYKELPQINIYNKDRKLIKTFIGGATMDSLKHYIQ